MVQVIHLREVSRWRSAGYHVVIVARPSRLGNPFRLGRDGSRDAVIEKYHQWLRKQYAQRNRVYKDLLALAVRAARGERIALACYCSPQHIDDAKQHVNDYNAWIDETSNPNDYPSPQDFARQVYPDLQIWEVYGYGRVWIDREGYWHHNGPKIGFFNICRERFEDAMSDLIQAVHLHLDKEVSS